jgi:pyridoxamine 5'-phosphate oxidase
MNLDILLQNLRVDYIPNKKFNEQQMQPDPISQLQDWLKQALDEKVPELNAMVLSTANKQGQVSSRIVLLKEITHQGLIFFTNYESHKATDIEDNQNVAINFFWQPMARQVRVQGIAKKITQQQSEDYFATRPRNSQIAAWASPQSKEIATRDELEEKVNQIQKQHAPNKTIPCPPFWGGYTIIPNYFEFWQGNRDRLHDRISYTLETNNSWTKHRLAP